jgi:gluconokinase
MADKIRLNSKGLLGAEYLANLGKGFDERCTSFLGLDYEEVVKRVMEGGSDEEILCWCHQQGSKPSESQLFIWNEFMRKCGWNDALSARLKDRLRESGFADRTDIQTFFDYIDLDEHRL